MEISLLLAEKIASMLIMVLMGYILVRIHILDDNAASMLSLLALYLVNPCKLITAFIVDYDRQLACNLLQLFLYAIAIHLIFIAVSHIAGRTFNINPACKGSIIYTNCGNLLLPIIAEVLGQDSLFYSCAYYAAENIFIWTHLQVLMGNPDGMSLKKILINPNIAAIAIGLFIFVSGIHPTGPIYSSIAAVGDMTGPLAMLVTGCIIAKSDLTAVFGKIRIWCYCLLRLIVYPLFIIVIMKMLSLDHFIHGFNKLAMVGFLAVSAPTATSVVQLAKLDNGDYESANAINIMTILLCVLTMPVMIYLYQLILL